MTERIPGPKGWPLIGNVLDIDPVDAVACLGRIADEYGASDNPTRFPGYPLASANRLMWYVIQVPFTN
jgi:hypothetical protein